jgi:hypothetical protein
MGTGHVKQVNPEAAGMKWSVAVRAVANPTRFGYADQSDFSIR